MLRKTRKRKYRSHAVDYSGYTFKSKLETRWAYLFNLLSLSWVYEGKMYNVQRGKLFPHGARYVPDFHFVNLIAEVKPTKPTQEEIVKAISVLSVERKKFCFLVGMPGQFNECLTICVTNSEIDFKIIPVWSLLEITEEAFFAAVEEAAKIKFMPKRKQ